MKLVSALLTIVLEDSGAPSAELIKKSFEDKINVSGIEGVTVGDVDVDHEGNITVDFSDGEDEISILFSTDPEEGITAIILDDSDDDEEEISTVDLDAFNPVTVDTEFGKYVDLTNLSWMSKTTFISLLMAGDIDTEVAEAFKLVVRGGRRVRLPIVRRVRRKRLTAKQKAGIRRAVAKRRAKRSQTSKKLKKSLKIRKKLGIKRGGLRRGQRVSG